MKYMAIIDADEKPVSCEFFGCNGNVQPYLLGATTDIKTLEQEPKTDTFDKIIADIDTKAFHFLRLRNMQRVHGLEDALEIIDKYRKEQTEE